MTFNIESVNVSLIKKLVTTNLKFIDMDKSIKIGRLLLGLLLFFTGIIILTKASDNSTVLVISLVVILIGILLIIFCRAQNYYCADCGQFLGSGFNADVRCPRCGCNIYTDRFTGVGKTRRNR